MLEQTMQAHELYKLREVPKAMPKSTTNRTAKNHKNNLQVFTKHSGAYPLGEQISTRTLQNQKFVSGGQFRNSKSLKKQGGMNSNNQLLNTMQSSTNNLNQQYMSLQTLQAPPSNSYFQPTKTTSVPASIKPIALHQLDSHSQYSNGSQENSTEQNRRRLVALAQAQQQQIFAHNNRLSSQQVSKGTHQITQQINNENTRSSGNLHDQNGKQIVISKKLISFRSESKSGKRKNNMQFKNSTIQDNDSDQRALMSLTQPFSMRDGTTSDNQQAQGSRNTVFNQSQVLNNLNNIPSQPQTGAHPSSNNTAQISPRKPPKPRQEGTSQQVQSARAANSVDNQGNMGAKSVKTARLVSGRPQRRINGQNNPSSSLNPAQSAKNAGQISSRQGPSSQAVTQTISQPSTIQAGYNRRRQIAAAAEPEHVQLTTRQHNYGTNSISTRSGDFQLHTIVQNQSQKALKPNSNAMDSMDIEIDNNVIFHPHPLNKNVPNFNTIQMQKAQNGHQQSHQNLPLPLDSSRPNSHRPNNLNCNRNSRKNLKPIGGKKKPSNGQFHLNLLNKGSKSSKQQQARQQYASNATQGLVQQEMISASSRERTVQINPNMFSTNQNHINSGGSFKNTFKHVAARNDAAQHMGQSGRRPIVLRKNNFVTQQLSSKSRSKPVIMMSHNVTAERDLDQINAQDAPSVGNGLSELAGLTGLTGLSGLGSTTEPIDRSEMTSMPNVNQGTGSLQRTTMQGTILKFDDSNVEGSGLRNNQQTVTTNHGQQVQPGVHEEQRISNLNKQLIKVNKSKKQLDTARRSRINQLETGEANDFKSAQGIPRTLNLVSVSQNSIGGVETNVPLTTKNATQVTNKLVSTSIAGSKFNNTIEFSRNNYQQSETAQTVAKSSNQHSNTLQLNMNIGKDKEKSQINKNLKLRLNIPISEQGTVQKIQIKQQTPSAREATAAVSQGSRTLTRGQIFKKQQFQTQSKEALMALDISSKEVTPIKAETANVVEETISQQEPSKPVINSAANNEEPDDEDQHTGVENTKSQVSADEQPDNNNPGASNLLSTQEDLTASMQTNQLKEIKEEDIGGDYEQSQKTEEHNSSQVQKLVLPPSKLHQIQNKLTDQRTTFDTNSNRKVNTDSQQRTNFNTSMQNIPRGLINTAFSLNSVGSREQEKPPLPIKPQMVLKHYIHELTDYEKGEVLDYDMVYFLGLNKKDKVDQKRDGLKVGKENETSKDKDSSSADEKEKSGSKDDKKEPVFNHNHGYDDDKGDYKIVTGDHIGFRYQIVEFLGKGSFGTAIMCIDHKEKKKVAVKIVKNKKKYYYQASVELKILQYLKQHDVEDIMNVIHIYDYVIFRKHLCMAFELLSMNLFEFLKINDFNGFDHNLIRRFAIQLLYALKYLKQLEIIHCDLKPENILLKEENKSGIKIIDFGSSTFVDEKVYTYIQSRFYRAPEIMLGIPYTTAIDMWSLGCIMAELYIGYPIFPGESENDQMSRIMEMRDVPPAEVLKVSERKGKFFAQNKETKKLEPVMLKNSRGKLRKPNGKPLGYVIGDEDPDFTDFVLKCLDWNPSTRLSPDDALKHIWVLKGLPPQVLIHHQKMHNIATPELPEVVKVARDEFIAAQQIENNQSQRANQPKKRLIPEPKRPQVQLKTPKAVGGPSKVFGSDGKKHLTLTGGK